MFQSNKAQYTMECSLVNISQEAAPIYSPSAQILGVQNIRIRHFFENSNFGYDKTSCKTA
jgi:hypothetical protein